MARHGTAPQTLPRPRAPHALLRPGLPLPGQSLSHSPSHLEGEVVELSTAAQRGPPGRSAAVAGQLRSGRGAPRGGGGGGRQRGGGRGAAAFAPCRFLPRHAGAARPRSGRGAVPPPPPPPRARPRFQWQRRGGGGEGQARSAPRPFAPPRPRSAALRAPSGARAGGERSCGLSQVREGAARGHPLKEQRTVSLHLRREQRPSFAPREGAAPCVCRHEESSAPCVCTHEGCLRTVHPHPQKEQHTAHSHVL